MRSQLFALASLVVAMPAAAQNGGAWQTSRSNRSCTLTVDLSDGAHVEFSRSSTSTDTWVRVAPPPRSDQDAADPYKAFGNPLWIANRPAFHTEVQPGRGGAGTAFSPGDMRAVLSAASLKVYGPNEGSIVTLPSAGYVEPLMQACLTELRLAERGSGEPQAVKPVLKADLSATVGEAIFEYEHVTAGRIRVRLTVAAQGHTLACDVLEPSGKPYLDQRICGVLMRRARFAPATDSAGRPTLGTYETTLAWKP